MASLLSSDWAEGGIEGIVPMECMGQFFIPDMSMLECVSLLWEESCSSSCGVFI